MRYRFIINPGSGRKVDRVTLLRRALDAHLSGRTDVECELRTTDGPGHAQALATEAAAAGLDAVVAAGGDGTVNEVASGLISSNTALSVVPLGSGNGFARSLRIPLDVDAAVALCLNPTYRAVDVGRVGAHTFVGVAGLGIEAQIGACFQASKRRGPLPYFWIGAREFLRYRSRPYRLELDSRTLELHALTIAIANTEQYGNNAVIAPGADCTDGLLDVCIVRDLSAWHCLRGAIAIFRRTIDRLPGYTRCRTRRLTITALDGEPIGYHTDGEPHATPNALEATLLTQALKVCCPTPAHPPRRM
jgi:YegS/Rv2252/BmrU family lipid kinase